MAESSILFTNHIDGGGSVQLQNMLFHKYGEQPAVGDVAEGEFWYNSISGTESVYFKDNTIIVKVPRLDKNEGITGTYQFAPASGAPFTTTSTTMVTNLNSELLAGRLSAAGAVANTIGLRDANGKMYGADASAGTELVNYQVMAAYTAGIRDPKDSCEVATITVLPDYTETGNILTADDLGILTIDTVDTVLNDRILVKDETGGLAKWNGLWYVSTQGTVGVAYKLTRVADADTSEEVTNGLYVWITGGSLNIQSGWIITTPDPFVLNTNPITFVQINGTTQLKEGNGIDISGNVVSLKIAGGTTWTDKIIPFATSTTAIGEDSTFVYDDSTNRMGVGTAAPDTALHVNGGHLRITNSGGGSNLEMGSMAPGAAFDGWIITNSATDELELRRYASGSGTLRWTFTTAGVLQAAGAQTVETAAGVLTIQPAGDTEIITTSGDLIIGSETRTTSLVRMGENTNGSTWLHITNRNTGASSNAGVVFGNAVTTEAMTLRLFSSGFSTAGQYIANNVTLHSALSAGLTLSAAALAPIRIYPGNALAWTFLSTGVLQAAAAQSITTAAGALTIAPASGSNFIITNAGASGTVITSGATTGNAFSVIADSLEASGRAAYFYSNASGTQARNIVEIVNDNVLAINAAALKITQKSAQQSIDINHDGTAGDVFTINSLSSGTTMSISVDAPLGASETGLFVDSNVAQVSSGSALFRVRMNHASSTQTAVRIDQDGTGDILNLFDGSTEVFTVLDGGKVGIGTTDPDGTLHVHTGDSGAATADEDCDDIVIESDAAGGMQILTPANLNSNIRFGSSSSTAGALIRWNHDAEAFTIASNQVGSKVILKGDNFITNLTLSGVSGSERAKFEGTVGVGVAASGNSGIRLSRSLAGGWTYGIRSEPTSPATATTEVNGIYVSLATAAGEYTHAALAGLRIDDAAKGTDSTITAQYGIYIGAQTKGATSWGIYNLSADVYLGSGNVGINNTNPGKNLDITGSFRTSGVNTLTNIGSGVVQSASGVLSSSLTLPADTLASDDTPIAKIKFFDVGGGTEITLTHSFETRDVAVELWLKSGTYDTTHHKITRPTDDTVQIDFIVAPDAATYRCSITAAA